MLLSVIIVSYNTKFFLEQCLHSVRKAIDSSAAIALSDQSEIFVIDNHSEDRSPQWLAPIFPNVSFISNQENIGFGRANNQGLLLAKGKYVLFLNPDCILSEDCLEKCISLIEADPMIAATGVRMIDGTGQYLPESKRGFPSPWVSFCRLSGIAALFPTSRVFGGYYLSYLDANKDAAVDVLSGAFMMVQKKILDEQGGFDEQFFMYAEDIDLSYRMQTAGYRNVYLASTSIVHFKGESTRKDARYVNLFYRAMMQFLEKHYSESASRIFIPFLKLGVWIKKGMARIPLLIGHHAEDRKGPFKTLLLGDGEEIARLAAHFPLNDRSLADSADSGNEIIFCAGKDFSYRQIIDEMQLRQRAISMKIHAAGSHSAVGSDSKNRQGDVIALS